MSVAETGGLALLVLVVGWFVRPRIKRAIFKRRFCDTYDIDPKDIERLRRDFQRGR